MKHLRRKIALLLLIVIFLLVVAITADLRRQPEEQISAKALLGMISIHRKYASPILERFGARCKFTPTCSEYAEEAIRRYGALEGSKLAVKRLARCTPWSDESGDDPVPDRKKKGDRSRPN